MKKDSTTDIQSKNKKTKKKQRKIKQHVNIKLDDSNIKQVLESARFLGVQIDVNKSYL